MAFCRLRCQRQWSSKNSVKSDSLTTETFCSTSSSAQLPLTYVFYLSLPRVCLSPPLGRYNFKQINTLATFPPRATGECWVFVILWSRRRVYRWPSCMTTYKTSCLTSTATTDFKSLVLMMTRWMMKMRDFLYEHQTSAAAAAVAARTVGYFHVPKVKSKLVHNN